MASENFFEKIFDKAQLIVYITPRVEVVKHRISEVVLKIMPGADATQVKISPVDALDQTMIGRLHGLVASQLEPVIRYAGLPEDVEPERPMVLRFEVPTGQVGRFTTVSFLLAGTGPEDDRMVRALHPKLDRERVGLVVTDCDDNSVMLSLHRFEPALVR